MPHENQGAPTILSVPAPLPPPTVVPAVAVPARFELPLSQPVFAAVAACAVRNRDPPRPPVANPKA